MKIKPTKLFYLGCFVITAFGIYIGSFVSLNYSIMLSFLGVVGFIDLELINILVHNLNERGTSDE